MNEKGYSRMEYPLVPVANTHECDGKEICLSKKTYNYCNKYCLKVPPNPLQISYVTNVT